MVKKLHLLESWDHFAPIDCFLIDRDNDSYKIDRDQLKILRRLGLPPSTASGYLLIIYYTRYSTVWSYFGL